jgi:hypothetical protein
MTAIAPTGSYRASRIKRQRATKAEMEERWQELLTIVSEQHPMTVRQVFYQASVRGVVEKSEYGYSRVQIALVNMRRAGVLPYGHITDNTRRGIQLRAYNSIQEALEDTAKFYRRRLWTAADCYVEMWLEKDALAGVIEDITLDYDVPLMVSRGYASLSFLYSAAQAITHHKKPAFIYHFGDHDPSGVNAAEKIEETLRDLAPDAEIHFERVAVTSGQIKFWNLPTRPTKTSDSRSKNWSGGDSVELDAIKPSDLRELVRDVIEGHIDQRQLDILEAAEESERTQLRLLAAGQWLDEEDDE